MILERKITDLPEKHSVIQIHTGKGEVFFIIKFDLIFQVTLSSERAVYTIKFAGLSFLKFLFEKQNLFSLRNTKIQII